MFLIQIEGEVWGEHKKGLITENLSRRTNTERAAMELSFDDRSPKQGLRGSNHFTVRLYSTDSHQLTDSDLGEAIRLILSEDSSFVNISSVQIQ